MVMNLWLCIIQCHLEVWGCPVSDCVDISNCFIKREKNTSNDDSQIERVIIHHKAVAHIQIWNLLSVLSAPVLMHVERL